jgi:hypothetical protein
MQMNFYLQYHNVANEGLFLSDPPFSATRLAIHTRRPNVQQAEGRVFLIAGIGRPRRFFLWETFEIEEVVANGDGEFEATGTGWQLAPPVELTGKPFEDFKAACANFVGFRSINDLPFTRTLTKLAEDNRPPGEPEKIVSFLNTLDSLLTDDDPERAAVRTVLGHYQPVRAPAWFGRDLKTLIPKLQEGRENRVYIYRGLGVRQPTLPEELTFEFDCTADKNLVPSRNGRAEPIRPGHPGHLDCFAQLFKERSNIVMKVVENNGNAQDAQDEPPSDDKLGIESDCAANNLTATAVAPSHNGAVVLSLSGQRNAMTALTGPLNDDSEGDKHRAARRISQNLRQEYRNGYVVQPDPKNLSNWKVGKNLNGEVRWLDRHGTREWAVGEVRRRNLPKTTPPPSQGDEEDYTEMTADETWKWLEENLVGTR